MGRPPSRAPRPVTRNAKLAMLAMLEAYQDSYDLKWAYIVFGEPLLGRATGSIRKRENVAPSLIKEISRCEDERRPPSLCWGATARPKRDFVYIKDAARIALGVMNGRRWVAVNMGSGQVFYRIRDVVRHAPPSSRAMSGRIEWDTSKPNGARLSRLRPSPKIDSLGLRPALLDSPKG